MASYVSGSSKVLLSITAATDAAILCLVGAIGPIAAIGAFPIAIFLAACLFLRAGFPLAVGLISCTNVVGSLDFDLIRAAKWLIIAAIGTVACMRLILERTSIEFGADPVVKYFLLYLS